MFKSTINNGSEQLGFQQKVSESSRVDTDIRSLLHNLCLAISGGSGDLCGNGLGYGLFFLFVINKVVGVFSHFSTRKRGD